MLLAAAIPTVLAASRMNTMVAALAIAVAFMAIGLKGFSEEGLPVTPERNLTGTTAQLIGVGCMTFGFAVGLALIWACNAAS
jgi:hypothetical protein